MGVFRKNRHDHPVMPKWATADDINEWMQRVTKDPKAALQNPDRISKHDLEQIAYAIQCAERGI